MIISPCDAIRYAIASYGGALLRWLSLKVGQRKDIAQSTLLSPFQWQTAITQLQPADNDGLGRVLMLFIYKTLDLIWQLLKWVYATSGIDCLSSTLRCHSIQIFEWQHTHESGQSILANQLALPAVENWRYKYSHISQNAKLTLKLSHSSIDDTLALGGAKRSHAPLFFVF